MIQNMGRRLKTTSRQMLLLCGIVLGMASMAMQSCSEAARDDRPALCGNWESVEGKPDVLIYKEGKAYKVTVFKRKGLGRELKPQTYLLQMENGNLFMNTGFRIDVSYNEETDVLTFSPNGDYIRSTKKDEADTDEYPGFSIAEDAMQGVSFSDIEDALKVLKETSHNR